MREMAAEDGRRASRARHPQEFEQILVHTGQHYGNGTLLLQHVEGVLRGRIVKILDLWEVKRYEHSGSYA